MYLAIKKKCSNSNIKISSSSISTEAQCLLNKPLQPDWYNANFDINNLTGQIWSANDQCQMVYGRNASFCQVINILKENDVAFLMLIA